MKSNLLWAALLFFAPYLSTAQPLVKLGKPYLVVDAGIKFYYEKGKEIYTVKIGPDGIRLSIINSETLEQTKTAISKLPKNFSYENVMELDNKYYLFYSVLGKGDNKEQLMSQILDFNTCKIDGIEKQVLSVNKAIADSPIGTFKSYGIVNKFNFYHSFDKSKLLIVYRLLPEKKRDAVNYDVIGMNVFDNSLNKLSIQEIKMPHTEKQMDNMDYAVDYEGNAFVLSIVYGDDNLKKDKKLNYSIELLKVKPNSSAIATIPVLLQGKFVNKLKLFETSKNKMVCAGYYSNFKKSNSADGIMHFNISSDNKITDMINHEIPIEVLNQFVNEKTQNNNDKREKDDIAEFAELVLNNLIIQADGSMLIIGEQSFQVNSTYYSQGSYQTITTTFFNDILTCKVNANGSLAWMRKLPKKQVGSDIAIGLSYKYMKGENEHIYIFMDNEKNMQLPLNKYPEKHVDGKGGFLTAYKVSDATGAVEKISILNTLEIQGHELSRFAVNRIVSISPNEFVFEAFKKAKEDVMLKVKFSK